MDRGGNRSRSQSRGPPQDKLVPQKKFFVCEEDFARRRKQGRCTYCDKLGDNGRPPHLPADCPLMQKGEPPVGYKEPASGK